MVTQNSFDLNKICAEIQPDQLAKQGFARPRRVSLEEGTDSDGERAYHIYLIYPDQTSDADLAWQKIEPMVSWVWKHVLDATGGNPWPYIRVKREGEMLAKLG